MNPDANDSPLVDLADRFRAFTTDDERVRNCVLRDAEEEAGDRSLPVFVHGDDLHNTIIDPHTHEIVGLVDFELDWAAPAWAEHFYGLVAVGHIHFGPEDDDPAMLRHSQALLHPEDWKSSTNSFPPAEQVGEVSGLRGDDGEDIVTWDVMHAWVKDCAE
ncbi:hypothetical protein CF319_g1065 [Tilletia indica]|nr:hypothetical protein CF319_g1065 [Tilletia indica]